MTDSMVGVDGDEGRSLEKPRIPSLMLVSLAASVVLTGGFYLAVIGFLCRGTYVEVIFTQRGIIPYMTTYLAFVALVQLLCLFLYVWHESRSLGVIAKILGGTRIITATVLIWRASRVHPWAICN